MNDSQASAETRVGTVVRGVWKLLMGPHRGMPLSRAFTVTVTMIPGTLKKKKKRAAHRSQISLSASLLGSSPRLAELGEPSERGPAQALFLSSTCPHWP